MIISYIPAVVNVPENLPGTEAARDYFYTQIYQAVHDVLEDVIVKPFCSFIGGLWVKFVDVSFVFCLSATIVGIICGALGIRKGYRVATFSIVFYFLLRLVSKAYGWY